MMGTNNESLTIKMTRTSSPSIIVNLLEMVLKRELAWVSRLT